MDGGSKPLLSGLNGCRLGLNRGRQFSRSALCASLLPSAERLRPTDAAFYGTAEAVPFRFLLPCGLWVGWASDPTHEDETVMNGGTQDGFMGGPAISPGLSHETNGAIDCGFNPTSQKRDLGHPISWWVRCGPPAVGLGFEELGGRACPGGKTPCFSVAVDARTEVRAYLRSNSKVGVSVRRGELWR